MESHRILLTTTYYPPDHVGGDAVHVMYLAEQLVRQGHEVHVVYAKDITRLKGAGQPVTITSSDPPRVHPLSTGLPIVNAALSVCAGMRSRLVQKASELAERLRPDVVHHHNVAGFGPQILRLQSDVTLYTAHDFWLACAKGDFIGRAGNACNPATEKWWCSLLNARPPQLWRLLSKSLLTGTSYVIAPSHFMARAIQPAIDSIPLEIVPNFVPRKMNIQNRVNDGLYVLFVGVLEERKGPLQLLESYLGWSKDLALGLKIVGNGPLRKKLESRIATSGRRDIELRGWVDDRERDRLYRKAVATILPSQSPENCPLVAIEALAQGCPILATDTGGLPEIASSPACSRVLTKGLGDLPMAIENWAQDPQDLEDARKAALQMYELRFSPDVFMKRYNKLLGT